VEGLSKMSPTSSPTLEFKKEKGKKARNILRTGGEKPPRRERVH